MNLKDSLDKMKFDTRLVDWNIANKVITQDELDKHISKLGDDAGQAAPVEIDDELNGSFD